MKILLTGATGLVGKELGKHLIQAGHSLLVLARNVERAKLELPFPAEVFAWDGVTGAPPAEALANVDGVVHLAGENIAAGRWSKKRKKAIYDSRILGTRYLADAVAKAPSVKVFVSASAIGIYGDRANEVLTEESKEASGWLADVCRDWEKATHNLPERVRVANLRIGVVLARQGGAMEKLLPLFTAGLGGAVGSGKQWMSWIHIQDFVRLCEFALVTPSARGAINAVAPNTATNYDFSRALAKALGRGMFLPAPALALKLAMGEMSSIVLASQNVSSKKLQNLGFNFTHHTVQSAFAEICAPLRGGQRELLAEQWVPKSPEEIFPFFCDEKNLEKLTPEFLHFKVLGKSTSQICDGTLIDYRLKLHGIPLRWQSRIDEWKPGKQFVDQQITGPYKRWHHTHEFIPMASGTLIRDRVSYSLPLGRLGDALASWKVVRDVQAIFSYRRRIIRDLFA